MTRFISRRNTITPGALKRKPLGTVIRHHNGSWEDVKFTRVEGGWIREREDIVDLRPEVVSSVSVADECNHAFGCAQSWAEVY